MYPSAPLTVFKGPFRRHRSPTIQVCDPLPVNLIDDAAALYLCALADKLVPVLGTGVRARQALAAAIDRRMGIAAVDRGRLAGVLGIQTAQSGFMNMGIALLRSHYGIFGSLWRTALLSLLHYAPMVGEVYVDGIVVAPHYRGRGVGTGLMHALEVWAMGRGLSLISLEVVDANPRAKTLYGRLGFEVAGEQTAWPIGSLFGFQSSATMIKPLVRI